VENRRINDPHHDAVEDRRINGPDASVENPAARFWPGGL
jgi:hypothetical protein